MILQPRIRMLARWGRSILLPIGSIRQHLRSLVHKTGKELHFESTVIQYLEIETEATLKKMGINQ